ncbi:hypothetical protein BaRGS_00031915, partial [Batillaria attramentaria]
PASRSPRATSVLTFIMITSESSPGTPPGTDDDHEIQSESSQTHNVVIVVCIAGLAMLAIVAFIFMYAKAARRTVKWSRAAIPFVQENAEARPRSENIYHEIDEHPEDCELPQSNPQPSMDEDGYLAPRNSNTLEPTGPNFTTETPTDTTGNPEIEPKTFQNENVAIVSAIAGFVVLAIIAIIIVCVKTGRGKTDTEVEMTHQETSDSPPHDMYPGHRRTQYCELTWENVQPGQGRNLTTEGMRTRRESATPYAVVQVAPSRSMSNVSEDIYHKVGNTVIVHASQGDQSERPLPPPPDLDPDGYMTPRPATH